jgi:hypothetical protein
VDRFRLHCAWLLLAVASCFQTTNTDTGLSNDQGTCVGHCGHSTIAPRPGGSSSGSASSTTVASGGGSTSGGSGSSGSTSSGGSPSSGGSSSGNFQTNETFCPGVAIGPVQGSCATGTSFASQLVDILSCSAIPSATIAAIGADGVPVSGAAATTANNGGFTFCPPMDSAFSIQVTASGYPTTYYAEMLDTNVSYISQLAAVSNGALGAFGAFIPGGFATDKAVAVVKLTGTSCILDYAGYTISLELPDGGPVPDGGYELVYLDVSGVPNPKATETDSEGAAILYNIDSTISDFYIVVPGNPDAGSCPPVTGADGFTGRIFVASGTVAVAPIVLP